MSEYWFGTRVTLETGSEQGYIRVWVRKSYQGVSVYWFETVIKVVLDTGSVLLSGCIWRVVRNCFFWILIRDFYPGKSGDWFRTFIWVYLGTGSERYVT